MTGRQGLPVSFLFCEETAIPFIGSRTIAHTTLKSLFFTIGLRAG